MTVSFIHERLANTVLIFFIFLTAWGYLRFFRKQGMDPSYWGALVIAEGLLIVQMLFGAYLWLFLDLRPARPWVHLLYAFITLAAIPLAYSYTRGEEGHGEMLMYATTALISVGLVIRTMDTAQFALP